MTMKIFLKLFLILAVMTIYALPVRADGWDQASQEKIRTGIDSIIKSPLEIPTSLAEETKAAKFKPFGVVGGLIKGISFFVKDIGVGVVKVLTFDITKNPAP